MAHIWDEIENISLVDVLITEVLNNSVEHVVFILNYIRAKHPHTFEGRNHNNKTAIMASTLPHVSPLIMRILLLPDNRIYVGHLDDQSPIRGSALHSCVGYDQNNDDIKQRADAVHKAHMLLQAGAGVDFVFLLTDKTPLDSVASVDMARLLFEYGAGPGINEIHGFGSGDTVLMKSIRDGNIELTKFLLERGADIKLEILGHPLLHAAIRQGDQLNDDDMDIDMLEFLIEKGANFWSVGRWGVTLRKHARNKKNRYALRLIELMLADEEIKSIKWLPESIDKTYQSVIMSQHHRDGPRAGLCRMTPEIIQSIIHRIKSTIPVNAVASVMHSIKRRNNGRFPIKDSDMPNLRSGFLPFYLLA
jgi:hypothetical protein